VPGQITGVNVEAAIEMRLAATRLGGGEIDGDSQSAQQPDRCYAYIRKEGVTQTGDEEGDSHIRPSS
jgi:hypothetical protein